MLIVSLPPPCPWVMMPWSSWVEWLTPSPSGPQEMETQQDSDNAHTHSPAHKSHTHTHTHKLYCKAKPSSCSSLAWTPRHMPTHMLAPVGAFTSTRVQGHADFTAHSFCSVHSICSPHPSLRGLRQQIPVYNANYQLGVPHHELHVHMQTLDHDATSWHVGTDTLTWGFYLIRFMMVTIDMSACKHQ